MLWMRVFLPASLLLLALLPCDSAQAQNTNKRAFGQEPYYPWVVNRDSVIRGVNHMAFGTNFSGDVLEFEFALSIPQPVTINLFNLSGHNVASKSFTVEGRQLYTERILMGNLSTGFYILIIDTATERIVRKIMRP